MTLEVNWKQRALAAEKRVEELEYALAVRDAAFAKFRALTIQAERNLRVALDRLTDPVVDARNSEEPK
jgi:hypothetical protein